MTLMLGSQQSAAMPRKTYIITASSRELYRRKFQLDFKHRLSLLTTERCTLLAKRSSAWEQGRTLTKPLVGTTGVFVWEAPSFLVNCAIIT